MGKFESKPEIRGDTPKISSNELDYFYRINTLKMKYYKDNMENIDNLKNSLEQKSFKSNPTQAKNVEDITWLEYITNYIEDLQDQNHYSWCGELLIFIEDQSFLFESKYHSTFFYNEFLLKTIPSILVDEKDIDNDANIIDIDKVEDLYNAKKPINLEELDITANLGGSYLELNTDDLPPDDPTITYTKRRKLVKKYVKIFKEHVFKNNEHPIMCIITAFNRIFCKYIHDNLRNFEVQLRKSEISGDDYNKKLKDFEAEITENLQNFMMHMHCTLKLFYSTVIDYAPFQEEK